MKLKDLKENDNSCCYILNIEKYVYEKCRFMRASYIATSNQGHYRLEIHTKDGVCVWFYCDDLNDECSKVDNNQILCADINSVYKTLYMHKCTLENSLRMCCNAIRKYDETLYAGQYIKYDNETYMLVDKARFDGNVLCVEGRTYVLTPQGLMTSVIVNSIDIDKIDIVTREEVSNAIDKMTKQIKDNI